MAVSTGLEPCGTRFSKLVMARGVWSKRLIAGQLIHIRIVSCVLVSSPESIRVLDIMLETARAVSLGSRLQENRLVVCRTRIVSSGADSGGTEYLRITVGPTTIVMR